MRSWQTIQALLPRDERNRHAHVQQIFVYKTINVVFVNNVIRNNREKKKGTQLEYSISERVLIHGTRRYGSERKVNEHTEVREIGSEMEIMVLTGLETRGAKKEVIRYYRVWMFY